MKVNPTGLYTYPDVVVVCGTPAFDDAETDTLINPTVIFEVLSETTEAYDRGKKFAHYRMLPSLQDFVLVSQTEIRIDHYHRESDDRWVLSSVANPNGQLSISSIQCTLQVSEVYHKVNFEEESDLR